jgi:hypothetical protein
MESEDSGDVTMSIPDFDVCIEVTKENFRVWLDIRVCEEDEAIVWQMTLNWFREQVFVLYLEFLRNS